MYFGGQRTCGDEVLNKVARKGSDAIELWPWECPKGRQPKR